MADTWTDRIIFATAMGPYWGTQSYYSDTALEPVDDESVFNQVSLVWTRTTPTGIVDDVMVTSLAIFERIAANTISGLTSSQMAAVEARLNTFWTAVKGNHPAHITLKEFRWHVYRLNSTKPGPAVRVTPVGVAGAGAITTVVPDQNACTTTFTTASRKHWGRNYWPLWITANYTGFGRLLSTAVDAYSAALRTLVNGCETDGNPIAVRSITGLALLTIRELHMDDTPDVVRRRRAKHPSYIKVYTS